MTLLRFYLRRTWLIGVFASLALFGFQHLMAFVYRGFISNLEGAPTFLMRVIPKGVQAFLGIDRLPPNSVAGILALAYQHPFVIVIVCALGVSCTVEFLAGQIERLTIAHLLVRPVPRPLMPLYAFVVAATWLAVASASAILGTVTGFARLGYALPPAGQLIQLAFAQFALGCAVTGGSLFFSATTETRADAAGWSVSILLLMYVGNFVAQLWDAAKPWARFSIFNYYTPIEVFVNSTLPPNAWLVFVSVSIAGLVLACAAYAFREFRV